ncbi:MAG: hypothetical protein ACHQUA_01825 [Microgenomates group bacterium]
MNLSFIDESAKNPIAIERAKNIVQFFYYLQIPLAFLCLIKLGGGDPGRTGFLPIWPISWLGSIPYSEGLKIIFTFYLASAFISSLFWRYKFGKIIGFLGILQVHALSSSFGYIDHFFYFWLYTGFIFLFLPDTKTGIKVGIQTAKKFLFVFWGMIALILLTYTLSGIWKGYWGINQFFGGEIGSFSPYAFSTQIANRSIIESKDFYYSDFIINNPLLVWPMYLGAIYIEVFAFWVAFKPNLHRTWGFLLLTLHSGILLVMGIPFFETVLFLSFILLNSPFSKEKISAKEQLSDLLILGNLFLLFRKR